MKYTSLSFQMLLVALVLAAPVRPQGPSSPPDQRSKIDLRAAGQLSASDPYIDACIHDIGMFWTTINNNGIVGNVFGFELPGERKQAPSFYHPGYSRIQHGYYAALWVGGILRGDTLVSVAMDADWRWWERGYPMEFWPDPYPFGETRKRSNDPNSPYYDRQARAEQEFRAVYTDTFETQWFVPYNSYDGRSHVPLNIEVTQNSYSWSYKYAQDFILVDYSISNIGTDTIHDTWVGIYYLGCVRHRGEQPFSPMDDIVGYIYSAPHEFEGSCDPSLQAAYIVDNDGRSFSFTWDFVRTSSAFAIAPLRVPAEAFDNNFNWWTNSYGTNFNWGPRKASTSHGSVRSFSGSLGIPRTDADKYHLMSQREIDYCGYEAAVDHSDEGWLPPHEYGGQIARGHLPEFVTSFGSFDIPPGESRAFTVVMTIGEDIHYDRFAFQNVFDTLNPEPFIDQLDFEDLIGNIRWARVIYDNPGIDTDGDGDSGKWFWQYKPETGETLKIYCEGDGVPDFKGATPPPPPDVRVTPEDGRIIVRWNGRNTENYFDPISLARDFEGYRVYISRSQLGVEAVMLASYDHENYSRYIYDKRRKRYVLSELPFTLDSLRTLYGENFQPLKYTYGDPLYHEGTAYYFETVDYNVSDLTDPAGIHRLYPDAPPDTTDVDEEGRMRYYEYEYFIENLLTTVPYYVSVTAFDFGHPPKSLEPLESLPERNMVKVFASRLVPEALKDGKLDVYCYPNPYRINANYHRRGLEDHGGDLPDERARAICFANLPNQCRISIFSLDGDLVRELEHDEPPGSGTGSVHCWNVITRNTQAVVTGLYYWVVESDYGNQVGKLVIIK